MRQVKFITVQFGTFSIVLLVVLQIILVSLSFGILFSELQNFIRYWVQEEVVMFFLYHCVITMRLVQLTIVHLRKKTLRLV